MRHVFAGGSRRVTRLNPAVRERLSQMINKQLSILVGDANGADKAIQSYLAEGRYPDVVVFCTAGECRNNLGSWPVRAIEPPHAARDFAFYTAKDAAMVEEAEVGFLLWDGESAGTIVNAARMVAAAKPVVLYVSPQRAFLTLKTRQDLSGFLNTAPALVTSRIKRYIAEHARDFSQGSIAGLA